MLEDMALVSLPETINFGLCGKATFGINHKGVELMFCLLVCSYKMKSSSNLLSYA